jgi:hypothetical protein
MVDRVAQQVIATELEAALENHFHPSNYGYRPNKSAHQAIGQCRISQKRRAGVAKELKQMSFLRCAQFPISKIAELLKLKIQGWINYYGKFRMSEVRKVFRLLHVRLVKWIRNKYQRYRKQRWNAAYKCLQSLSNGYPNLFEHWKYEGFRP